MGRDRIIHLAQPETGPRGWARPKMATDPAPPRSNSALPRPPPPPIDSNRAPGPRTRVGENVITNALALRSRANPGFGRDGKGGEDCWGPGKETGRKPAQGRGKVEGKEEARAGTGSGNGSGTRGVVCDLPEWRTAAHRGPQSRLARLQCGKHGALLRRREGNSLTVTQSLTGVRVLPPQELSATAFSLRISRLALAVQTDLLCSPTREDPAIATEHISTGTQEDVLAEGWPMRRSRGRDKAGFTRRQLPARRAKESTLALSRAGIPPALLTPPGLAFPEEGAGRSPRRRPIPRPPTSPNSPQPLILSACGVSRGTSMHSQASCIVAHAD